MIIECINCNKVFDVNSDLIPSSGRTIQCGSCQHVWFYKNEQNQTKISEESSVKKIEYDHTEIVDKTKKSNDSIVSNDETTFKNKRAPIHKNTSLVKYDKKSGFTFGKLLSYIIVSIISFIALIIILDTFKDQLAPLFPELELILFNLMETLRDLILFFKDLM
tara:strand:- start:363 stop:851 length:489 start_codon:yes stop_codon:yes gene_type:complete